MTEAPADTCQQTEDSGMRKGRMNNEYSRHIRRGFHSAICLLVFKLLFCL